uniref:GH18 domain-containing protein n=1 Tax=Anopheles melas TaxID=34690 RepID=A0A182U9Y8_9DIPT
MGVLGSISAGNILWLNRPQSRKTFIDLLIAKMASYPEMSGVYLDFDGLTNLYQNWYALFVAELYTALTANNLQLITALPWDASASGDIYYSSTLSTLPFNVIKTHEEMYSGVATASTRPISPLFSLAAPFNDETKTIVSIGLCSIEMNATTIAASPATCNITVKEDYGTLVAEYCANLKAIESYMQGTTCGVVA